MSRGQFARTEGLLGAEAMKKLENARVAVFGIGGVGGYVCEALARSGVGALDLIDNDRVAVSNINRQIIAGFDTVGRLKVEVMKERIAVINPDARVEIYPSFFLPEYQAEYPFQNYDYIVDAVDTVTAKIALVAAAEEYHIPVVSSMGAGNKMDAGAFRVADLYKTKVCPLAKVMRRELKKRGIEKLKVVYSEETPIVPGDSMESGDGRRTTPGSIAFVPSVAGLLIAGEVIKDLVGWRARTPSKGKSFGHAVY